MQKEHICEADEIDQMLIKRNKEKIQQCNDDNHEFGYKSIGGFPGHEHVHTTGEQICLNCGKTFQEIIFEQREKIKKELLLIADKGEIEDLRREVENYFQ